MLQGWISVHRQIQEHWLWAEKPFSKGQAWIDLLMLANHEDKEFLFGKEVTSVKAGSLITSEVKLAERWGWSRHKVRDFLDILQSEQMIKKFSDRRRTTIFVDNYATYQDVCKGSSDNPRTSQGHLKDTNNNVNNANKELSYSFSVGENENSFDAQVNYHYWTLIKKGHFVEREKVKYILEKQGVDELYRQYGMEE